MSSRWDGDDRGAGAGDAIQLVPGGTELITAFGDPGWVAESPEVHLRPHIEEWCRGDGRLALSGAHAYESQSYVIDLQWRATSASVGQVRAAVFCLIGAFAESATYVRQRRVPGTRDDSATTLRFEVGTGALAPDARFHPHGHSVVINVTGLL